MLVASIVKISAFIKDVLDSEYALKIYEYEMKLSNFSLAM